MFYCLILALLDVGSISLLAHTSLGKSIDLNKATMKLGNQKTRAQIYIIFLALSLWLIGYHFHWDLRRLLTVVVMLPIIKLFNISRKNSLTIYLISILYVLCFQLVKIMIHRVFGFEFGVLILAFTIFSFIVAVTLYHSKKPQRMFYLIEKNLILKLCLYFLASGLLLLIYELTFDYNPPFLIYVGLVIVLNIAALIQLFYWLNKQLSFLSHQNHDLSKAVRGLLTAVAADNSNLAVEVDELRYLIGVESTPFVESKRIEDSFYDLITLKKDTANHHVTIKSQINYYENHHSLTITAITVILELLLDNAIESKTALPINVKISVSEESCDITVSNECDKKDFDAFSKAFKSPHSTKGGFGRGIGLKKLQEHVKRYNGTLSTRHEYCVYEECDFLIVRASFKD